MAALDRVIKYPILAAESILWKHFAAGGSTGVTVADVTAEAAASQGTNDPFIQFDGTVSGGGQPIIYIGLPNIPTKINGLATKIYGVDLTVAKVDATTTTAFIDTIGIYQVVPTANSVNITLTAIVTDTTNRMTAAQSATPVDLSIDFTPTAVSDGLLVLGITFEAIAEAIDWKIYCGGHSGVRVTY